MALVQHTATKNKRVTNHKQKKDGGASDQTYVYPTETDWVNPGNHSSQMEPLTSKEGLR